MLVHLLEPRSSHLEMAVVVEAGAVGAAAEAAEAGAVEDMVDEVMAGLQVAGDSEHWETFKEEVSLIYYSVFFVNVGSAVDSCRATCG